MKTLLLILAAILAAPTASAQTMDANCHMSFNGIFPWWAGCDAPQTPNGACIALAEQDYQDAIMGSYLTNMEAACNQGQAGDYDQSVADSSAAALAVNEANLVIMEAACDDGDQDQCDLIAGLEAVIQYLEDRVQKYQDWADGHYTWQRVFLASAATDKATAIQNYQDACDDCCVDAGGGQSALPMLLAIDKRMTTYGVII